MRINIITQPLFVNYGGTLQNYALQEVLRRMGHQVLTINPLAGKPASRRSWKIMARTMLNTLNRLRDLYASPFVNPNTCARKEWEFSRIFNEFILRNISKVDVGRPFTPDLANKYPADMWIVGSDQVWRPWCTPNIANYFFDFLPEGMPRMAYAASFGVDAWELTDEDTVEASSLIKSFRGVSVRENSGVTLCRQYLDSDATHVLDPTLLLAASDYLHLTDHQPQPSGKYIAAYILDPTPQKLKELKDISRSKGIPVKRIGLMHRNGFDSIEQWLATLAGAEMIVTDSFHGTAFSLIFDRPAKILSNDVRGNSRLHSLISTLELKTDNEGFHRLDDDSRRKLSEERRKSLDFLKSQLG